MGGGIVAPVRFRVFTPRRGHYRQFGSRSIGQQQTETLHAPHYKPLYTPEPDGSVREEFFIGLTDKLAEVTAQLCDQADVLIASADTLDEKLKVMIYFQLLGVSIIHPFADGNGRTFGAKLVLDLNRAGLKVDKMPGLPEVVPGLAENCLAGIGTIFLDHFMTKQGPGLFQGADRAVEMLNNPQQRRTYMTSLHDAIEGNIETGMAANSFMEPYIDSGVHALKLALSRDGFIERQFYDTHIQAALDQTAQYRE